MAELSIGVTLETLARYIATDSRDWGQAKCDAILWAVLVGWGCEEEHEHDEFMCSAGGFERMAERHRWAPEFAELIKDMRRAVARSANVQSIPSACTAETRSWDHFTPEQMDSYWIRCTLQGPHDEHKDEHTGLTWVDSLAVDCG